MLTARYRLVALTRVKFDGDIIEEYVRHTLRFVDHLYVVDNVSPDATREILAALVAEGLPLTVWHDEIHEGRDGIMTDLAHRVLEHDTADYCAIFDADEFLRVDSRAAFETALARLPVGAHGLVRGSCVRPDPNDLTSSRCSGAFGTAAIRAHAFSRSLSRAPIIPRPRSRPARTA